MTGFLKNAVYTVGLQNYQNLDIGDSMNIL